MRIVAILLLFLCTHVSGQPSPTVTPRDRDAALQAIKKWRGFDGTWEGEVRYVAAPKPEWLKERQAFRAILKNNEPKVFLQTGVRDWLELGSVYRTHQPDELTLVIHAYGSASVWTENHVVVLTRRTENAAELFIQRVVNNWAGTPQQGEDLVYGDSRAGKAQRQ